MTVVDVLQRARARIAAPEAWTHAVPVSILCALDAAKMPVDPADPRAVAWDIYGAICAEAGCSVTEDAPACDEAFTFLARVIDDKTDRIDKARHGTSFVLWWHDVPERRHQEVLAALDRAIALATAERGGGQEASAPAGDGASSKCATVHTAGQEEAGR